MSVATASLPRPNLFASGAVAKLLSAIGGEGEEIRVAGGAVRNAMLHLPLTDIDCATTTLPGETIRRAERAGFRTIPTGIEHGTVTVLADGESFEVTTLRADIATDGRRATVRFGRDFAADAARRDFTINALFADAGGRVTDYVGGLADLEKRRVRFIGDAQQRIREDYLRILRLFRFHATYGEGPLDREALGACIRERDGLDILSRERVRSEILKLMVAPRAGEMLREMIDAGFAARIFGGATNFARFEAACESDSHLTASDLLGLLAIECAEDAERLRARLSLSNAETDALSRVAKVSEGLRALKFAPSKHEARALIYRVGDGAGALALAMLAAAGSSAVNTTRALARWTPPPLPWRGADALEAGASPGPQIGAWLAKAESLWIEADFPSAQADLDRIWRDGRPA